MPPIINVVWDRGNGDLTLNHAIRPRQIMLGGLSIEMAPVRYAHGDYALQLRWRSSIVGVFMKDATRDVNGFCS